MAQLDLPPYTQPARFHCSNPPVLSKPQPRHSLLKMISVAAATAAAASTLPGFLAADGAMLPLRFTARCSPAGGTLLLPLGGPVPAGCAVAPSSSHQPTYCSRRTVCLLPEVCPCPTPASQLSALHLRSCCVVGGPACSQVVKQRQAAERTLSGGALQFGV